MENLTELNEITVQYKPIHDIPSRKTMTRPADVADVFRQTWDEGTIEYFETFKVMYLNSALKPIGIRTLASGTINSVQVDIRMLFATALACAATKIIICHNHPSGITSPSEGDIQVTKKIAAAGELLDVELLDSIIITKTSYNSIL